MPRPVAVMVAADIIADAVADRTDTAYEAAARILAALEAAGFVILAPQDIEWGTCPGQFGDPTSTEPHRVSLGLCSGCLEYDPA